MRILITLFSLSLLVGCASNTLVNPNLQQPIDPTKAEVVGSKIVGEGGIPHQIYAGFMDGKQLRHVAVDQTLKIWPIEPGTHEFRVEYAGSTGKVFIRPFAAEGRIKAELKAGHRYIVRIRGAGSDQIIFYFEDATDKSEAACSEPVKLGDIPVPVIIPL
jgi:hypothetical protein